MDFVDVQRRVIDLYGKEAYDQGLETIAVARPEHPDEDGILTFYEACLLGKSGRIREALETLEAGLDRGLWWAPGQLADSDLDSVRTLPGWETVLARGEQAVSEMSSLRPDPLVRPGATANPEGTFITLHGAGVDPMAHAKRWEEAAPSTWTVITPVGSVPMTSGHWAWPYDLSLEPLIEHLEGLPLWRPLILAGWSQGGGMAASMAWAGPLEVDGLLLFGPGLRDRQWDPGSHRHVPTYIVIGQHDLALRSCLELRERMADHGAAVLLDELPGKGHELPENLQGTIALALDWLLGSL